MITATLQVYEAYNEEIVHSTFDKDFSDEDALNRYLGEQNQHPFLGIKVIKERR
jgi:hypothetical protein